MNISRPSLKALCYIATLSLCLSSTPHSRAGDTKALGTAFAVGGGAILVSAATGLTQQAAHCACMSPPTSCPPPGGPWNHCFVIPLAAAALGAGLAMMMSGKDTAGAVEGKAGEMEAPGEMGGPSDFGAWPPPGIDCSDPKLKDTITCDPDGNKKIPKLLNEIQTKIAKTGIPPGIDITPDDIAKAKRMFDNYNSGNKDDFMADAGGSASDYELGEDGSASLAHLGDAYGQGEGDGSLFGPGASANYTGQAAGLSSGMSSGKIGPTTANLDNTQWNGMLDMKDPKTGRSLTIWERATRRYMGTPDGQRGFTMARLEHLRKKSQQKLAKDSPRKTTPGKKVAEAQKKNPSPEKPTQVSAGSVSTH